MSALDLLSEPRLAVEGNSAMSLPETLARLSAGEDLRFTHLRPHQQAAWHAFLVQLAYLALEAADQPVPPMDAAAWTELLLRLSAGQRCAWQLHVEDWQQPAFLQPPCSPGREADFKAVADSAQALDLLVTSRNFDEKAHKVAGFEVEQADAWVYALVCLQGGAPFQGAGHYSSMRMNGGFSARPQFRLVFDRGTGAEFLRDLQALIDQAERFDSEPGDIGSGRRLPLLWLERWDDVSLLLADVHPLALEVCRRVRLRQEDGRLVLRRAGSKGMRVAAKDQLGAVRDPWIPLVNGAVVKALTVQAGGLDYRRLSALLFDTQTYRRALLALPTAAERASRRTGTLIATVLVGGQGRTDGLLRRETVMPSSALLAWADADQRLAQRAQAQLQAASVAAGKVLRPALIQFIDGSDEVDWQHPDPARMVASWLTQLDASIDAAFFSRLFEGFAAGLDDATAHARWQSVLADLVRGLFGEACNALPTRHSSPLFAQVRAESLLRDAWRKQFGTSITSEALAA